MNFRWIMLNPIEFQETKESIIKPNYLENKTAYISDLSFIIRSGTFYALLLFIIYQYIISIAHK